MSDIDNSNLVFGVHWDTDVASAEAQFRSWGCNGIHDFTKERVMNGNAAREAVIASAKEQNARYLFNGSYDWGTGADSAVYRFRVTSYTGELVNGDDETIKFCLAWSGHK